MIKAQYGHERPVQPSGCLVLLLGLCLMICSSLPVQGQRMPAAPPPAEFGLQITPPNDPKPFLLMERGGETVIARRSLTIANPQAAGDLTGVDLHASPENDGMRVELWIVYNDLSNQEWWKDKKEKVVGQY